MNDIDESIGSKADLVRKRSRGRPPLPKGLKCLKCGTTDTPEWRVGETGPHTLCNACGLQYAKKKKWEIESKAKHSLKNILNDEEERGDTEMLSPVSPIIIQQQGSPQAFQSPQSFHPSSPSFQPSPPYQPTSPFQISSPQSFQPTSPFQQQSSFPSSTFQQPSSFQQYQPSSQQYQQQPGAPPQPSPQSSSSSSSWVYSRDHSNKLKANQTIQQHLQHSSAVDMPMGGLPPSVPHSFINSFLSNSSSSSPSSGSFSSISFSPLSFGSLSSSSSSESAYSPYSPHTHLR